MLNKLMFASAMLINLSDEKVISGSSSLPGTGSLSKFFQAVKEDDKKLFLSLQGLDCLQLKIILMPRRHILGCHIPLSFSSILYLISRGLLEEYQAHSRFIINIPA